MTIRHKINCDICGKWENANFIARKDLCSVCKEIHDEKTGANENRTVKLSINLLGTRMSATGLLYILDQVVEHVQEHLDDKQIIAMLKLKSELMSSNNVG